MALEDLTGASKFIDDLDELNPNGTPDQKHEGDNHIRGVKNVLKNTFPNLTAAMTSTAAQLNFLSGVVAGTAAASKALVLDGASAISGIVTLVATTLTGTNVNADNLNVDIATAKTLNGDLDLQRNGTGDISVDGTPIYGLVILDTPEVLVNGSSTKNSWQTVNSATLNAVSAKKAILRVHGRGSSISDTGAWTVCYIRKTGSGLAIGTATRVTEHTINTGVSTNWEADDINDVIVNLDSNSDFDWYHAAYNTASMDISLVGYYT